MPCHIAKDCLKARKGGQMYGPVACSSLGGVPYHVRATGKSGLVDQEYGLVRIAITVFSPIAMLEYWEPIERLANFFGRACWEQECGPHRCHPYGISRVGHLVTYWDPRGILPQLPLLTQEGVRIM